MKDRTSFPYAMLLFLILMLIIFPSDANAKGEPYFKACQVKAIHTPSGINTSVDAVVFDPNGTVPTTISSLVVTGPNGFSYSFIPADYYGNNEYWSQRPGLPADGEYTFTITDSEGKTAISHCYLKVGNTIALPDASSLQASGNNLHPTLSWGAISNYNGNLFYRARIFDMSNNTIWTSGFTTSTSVDVPSGKLSPGINYQWRVEAFDDYSFYTSNNRAVCDKIALNVDNSTPYFNWGGVYKRLDSDGTWTALDISITDPNGTIPGSINSVTVTGPGGFNQTLGSADYLSAFNEYYHIVSGSPAPGIYTFNIIDNDGLEATSYDYVETSTVPIVDINTLQASGNALSPILSWGVPSYNGSSIYFRVRIIDAGSNPVWSSSRIPSTWVAVPSGILQAGSSYQWQVRAYDNSRFPHFNVESRTDFVELAVNNSPPYFKYAFIYNHRQPDGNYTSFYVQVADPNGGVPASITSLKVTGPAGFSYDFKSQDYSSFWDSYLHQISGKPQIGVYTFTLKDNEGNSVVTHDYYGAGDDIPSFDESSFIVSGDPLAPTVSWSGISGYQGRLYYRLVIADAQNKDIWPYHSSRDFYTTQTVSSGKLQRGKSYLFRVEAYDYNDAEIFNNRLSSNWFSLPASKAMPWLPLLLLSD